MRGKADKYPCKCTDLDLDLDSAIGARTRERVARTFVNEITYTLALSHKNVYFIFCASNHPARLSRVAIPQDLVLE